jgi:hypothetical protein
LSGEEEEEEEGEEEEEEEEDWCLLDHVATSSHLVINYYLVSLPDCKIPQPLIQCPRSTINAINQIPNVFQLLQIVELSYRPRTCYAMYTFGIKRKILPLLIIRKSRVYNLCIFRLA